MNKEQFVTELSKLRSSSTFLTLVGYRNDHSEVSDYSIVFHMSYANALRKSIDALKAFDAVSDLDKTAKEELLLSFEKSLTKMSESSIEEREDAYTHFQDDDGNYVKGVKMHIESETLHLYGLVAHKRVIMPGTYPVKNKKSLTVAKDKLRKLCPVDKFRQFKITPGQVERISVENLSLLPPA